MSDDLVPYYERELAFVRDFARLFARKFPAEAGRLPPPADLAPDPHAERFIDGFALLAGRIHHKIDTEFPELTDALLGVLYPHLLAPIPSLASVRFEIDPSAPPPPEGVLIPAGTPLVSRPVGQPPIRTRWRTGYPVSLWPVRVLEARMQPPPLPPALSAPPRTAAALILRLEALGGCRFADLPLDRLRFLMVSESQVLALLYEVLFNHTIQVAFRAPGSEARRPPVVLPPQRCLAQVGCGLDEGILPWPQTSFVGFRLLTELLCYRWKFVYLDLGGWDEVRVMQPGNLLDVVLFVNRSTPNLEQGIHTDTFQLGCTPVVNAFEQSCEPIAVTHTRQEYAVVPTRLATEGMEVLSIDSVACIDPDRGPVEYVPFYAFTWEQTRETCRALWYMVRRPSLVAGDEGT
ncbi:MAG: type VI secretion system baseplate subunit TssF, partial [Gemmataceae bacterium]|nr:type VI secretion system baseplate subunit TssF [Gemmataceae bacterium]